MAVPRPRAPVPDVGVDDVRAAVAARAFDAWDAHVAVLDARGHVLAVNAAWDRFARDNGGEAVGEGADYFAVCDDASETEPLAATTLAGLRSVLAGSRAELVLEYPCSSRRTVERWFRLRARRLDGDGDGPQLLVVHDEITERRRIQDDVTARSLLLDEVDAAVIATDLLGVVTLWNPGAERLYGVSALEAVGERVVRLVVPAGSGVEPQRFFEELVAAGTWAGEFTARRGDGTTLPVHMRSSVVRGRSGEATGVVSISVDQSARLAQERELTRAARHLQAVTDSIGDGLCTLDGEGTITYVNPQGSRLLKLTAGEARGLPFFHLLYGADGPPAWSTARATARHGSCRYPAPDGTRLPVDYVATPLTVDEDDLEDVGWAVIFRDATARNAREDELAQQVEQVVWLGRIRDALDRDGFTLHAQPIVDLRTGLTVQHELLLRMRDPEDPERLISPGAFLPTAEELGVAPTIDHWVLERGIELAAEGELVEINLSATTLEDPALPHLIEGLIRDTAAEPTNIVFEITETALMGNHRTARVFADHVRRLGCGLALDDFGTGFGGFTYLKSFPLDFLKIDLEFVRDALTSPASRHVIGAIVSLAAAFDLQTVAEGVEDQATLELLRDLNVDLAQGYLWGLPAPVRDVLSRTATQSRGA